MKKILLIGFSLVSGAFLGAVGLSSSFSESSSQGSVESVSFREEQFRSSEGASSSDSSQISEAVSENNPSQESLSSETLPPSVEDKKQDIRTSTSDNKGYQGYSSAFSEFLRSYNFFGW